MKKLVVLSAIEQAVLRKLNNDELRRLVELKDSPGFQVLIALVNHMTDLNKNESFAIVEGDPVRLSQEHAFLRGKSGGQIELLRLIQGAPSELLRREEATRKKKERK